MKKEYLIGGVLGVVLCGIVAYAVITFIGMRNSETAQQLAQRLQQPAPLEVTVTETRQPAKDQLSAQGKAKKVTQVPAHSGSQKADELKADTLTGVRITLKNGRSIIADSCRDVSGKLFCVVSGGNMQIDRKDIASIRDVKLRSSSSDQTEESSDGKAADKAAAGAKGAEPGSGRMVRGLTAEQIKRLDEINERKTLLQPDREKLIKEREQLHADVKTAGVMRSQEQFDGFKNRISELETRITGFNDEVKRLNEEEKAIIEGQGKGQ